MLIDGEKWACEACVRGHRVSNCQHNDRPLHHINKKGRPVSQCTHCRTLRKSRSAHVKCDCGDRAHSRGNCTQKGEKDHSLCTCSHGGRCTCSLKKPQLESVPEVVQLSASKPRLSSANSESSLSHFANGVHKSYKYMNRGPYSIPRSHTISYPLAAHRSTDSLPATSGSASLAQIKDTFARNQDIRLVRSEHGSPHSSGISTLDHLDSHMPQLDLSYPAYATAQGNRPPPLDMSNISAPPPLDHFVATPDTDQPMYSAGLNGPHIDWSTFDIGYEGNHHGMPTSAPYVQSHSYPGFENSYMAHRAMTASSTGDASDVEDFPAFDSNPVHAPGLLYTQFPSDSSEVCESDYRMSEPPYIGLGSSTMLTSNNLESHDFDSFVLKGAGANQFETRSVGGDSAVSAHSHQAAFDVQKFAPTSAPTTTATFTMPITSAESSAPYWIPQYDSVSASLSPENEPIAESTAVWAN